VVELVDALDSKSSSERSVGSSPTRGTIFFREENGSFVGVPKARSLPRSRLGSFALLGHWFESEPSVGTIFSSKKRILFWRSSATRAGSLNARISTASSFWFESDPGTIFFKDENGSFIGVPQARSLPRSMLGSFASLGLWFELSPSVMSFVLLLSSSPQCTDAQ
jgi:hypothetical protein